MATSVDDDLRSLQADLAAAVRRVRAESPESPQYAQLVQATVLAGRAVLAPARGRDQRLDLGARRVTLVWHRGVAAALAALTVLIGVQVGAGQRRSLGLVVALVCALACALAAVAALADRVPSQPPGAHRRLRPAAVLSAVAATAVLLWTIGLGWWWLLPAAGLQLAARWWVWRR